MPLHGDRNRCATICPSDAKGLLRKRTPFTSHCRTVDRGKGSGCRSPFPYRACGRRVFGSAWPSTLPLLSLGYAHGARTARLLRARPMAKQSLCRSWQGRRANGSIKGQASRGRAALPRGRRRERRRCANGYDPGAAATGKMPVSPNAAFPMWQGRPRPCSKAEVVVPRHWHSNRFAIVFVRSSFAVRAPCAHQRLATASHKAKRPAKTFRPSKRPEKGVCSAQKIFSTFFQNPLARSLKM